MTSARFRVLRVTSALALCLPLLMPPHALAQSPPWASNTEKKARNLYLLAEGGDVKSILELRAAANAAEPWAALQYGYILHLGVGGVKIDKTAAKASYLRAAPGYAANTTGIPLAAYNLGLLYLWGDDTPDSINVSDAIKWFRVAGSAEGMGGAVLPAAMQLAVIYENGFGRQPRNLPEAAKWYGIASRFGDPVATYKYGRTLIEGEYVPRNPTDGLVALERAALKGSREAMYYLASLYSTGSEFVQQSNYQAAYWLMVAGLSLNGKVHAEYAASVGEMQRIMTPGEFTAAKAVALQFRRRVRTIPPTVRYNIPLNTPTQFY